MQIILLERVEKLGQMGDVVEVRPGFARNFLLPRGKGLRATKDNIAYFETQKKVLEANNLKTRQEAEKLAEKIKGITVAIIRQASESGQLYGSVSARDIADAVTAKKAKVDRSQVLMDRAFKILGLYPIKLILHPEVSVEIRLNIARSLDEARIQEERGVALIVKEGESSLSETADKLAQAEEKAAKVKATAEAAFAPKEGEEADAGAAKAKKKPAKKKAAKSDEE